jgi:hypothetical protein
MCACIVALLGLSAGGASAEPPYLAPGNGGTLLPYGATTRNPPRLEREDITIRFFKIVDYEARIDYRFRNNGPDTIVSLSQPENDYVVEKGRHGLNNLIILIDGEPVTPVYRRITNAPVFPEPNALWAFSVPFRRGQVRHIQIRYRSTVWGSCASGMNYRFANTVWRGSHPARTLLIIDTDNTPNVQEHIYAGLPLKRHGNRLSYIWPVSETPDELEVTTM